MEKLVTLPKEFGKGWLSPNASDLIKIAVSFGNFDVKEILKEIPRKKGVINSQTVANALQRISDRHKEKIK